MSMENNLKECFTQAQYGANPDLNAQIWKALVKRDNKITRLKLGIIFLLGLIAILVLGMMDSRPNTYGRRSRVIMREAPRNGIPSLYKLGKIDPKFIPARLTPGF